MSETNSSHNQDPTIPPPELAFSHVDINFISDYAELIAARLAGESDPSRRNGWADRTFDVVQEQVSVKEESRYDSEPFKLIVASASMGTPISPDKFFDANQMFGDSPLISDQEKTYIAKLAAEARKYRGVAAGPEVLVADEMSRRVQNELARPNGEPDSTQVSPYYKLALKAFQFGATIGSEANAAARNSLVHEMHLTPAPHMAA